ncbi:putative serine hydrolase FSH, alpha/Beta hydrolase [Septoria linicola]|nr:putative serine hydrolase FSH, alpha/Beta hydrolase [Septoria linicola]
MLTNYEATGFDAPTFNLAAQIAGADSLESSLEVEFEKQSPAARRDRKMRVLCLHGFGQSGDFFRMKMKRITQYLENALDPDLQADHADGIEWMFPDGPIELTTEAQQSDILEMRAWWTRLDFTIRLDQLYSSLDYLTKYIREYGPFDGIFGFSQGASIAMMLTALCEGSVRPERVTALANQGLPLLIPPPQSPFKFAIACSGFRNAPQFYDGFFTPKITTPSMHVIADWDHMVSAQMSADIIAACESPIVIRHAGTHAVPTDRASMWEMAQFFNQSCVKAALAERSVATEGNPLRRASLITYANLTITAVTNVKLLSENEMPPLTEGSTSPKSSSRSSSPDDRQSVSGVTNATTRTNAMGKKRRLRFARKITVRRF